MLPNVEEYSIISTLSFLLMIFDFPSLFLAVRQYNVYFLAYTARLRTVRTYVVTSLYVRVFWLEKRWNLFIIIKSNEKMFGGSVPVVIQSR